MGSQKFSNDLAGRGRCWRQIFQRCEGVDGGDVDLEWVPWEWMREYERNVCVVLRGNENERKQLK